MPARNEQSTQRNRLGECPRLTFGHASATTHADQLLIVIRFLCVYEAVTEKKNTLLDALAAARFQRFE